MSNRHRGAYYVNEAARNGLRVEPGKGSHVKIYAPPDAQIDREAGQRDYTVVPMHNELSPGLESSIRKWFLRIGILLALVIAVWVAL